MDKNLISYFCSSYYNNLNSVTVIDHNETTHLGETLEYYYVARVKVDDCVLTVTTNYKEFESCTSIHDMCDVLGNNLCKKIFHNKKLTKSDIDDYFNLTGAKHV